MWLFTPLQTLTTRDPSRTINPGVGSQPRLGRDRGRGLRERESLVHCGTTGRRPRTDVPPLGRGAPEFTCGTALGDGRSWPVIAVVGTDIWLSGVQFRWFVHDFEQKGARRRLLPAAADRALLRPSVRGKCSHMRDKLRTAGPRTGTVNRHTTQRHTSEAQALDARQEGTP
ncbi:unnamed protein product [Boreogadus saida]